MPRWIAALPDDDWTWVRLSTQTYQWRRYREARTQLSRVTGAIAHWRDAIDQKKPYRGRGVWTEAWSMLERLENRLIDLLSDMDARAGLRRSAAKLTARLLSEPEPPAPPHRPRMIQGNNTEPLADFRARCRSERDPQSQSGVVA